MQATSNVQWCKSLFASLKPQGVWGVPRSGLVFQKDNDSLVLQSVIPGIVSPEESEADYQCIKSHFADAGINVRKSAKH